MEVEVEISRLGAGQDDDVVEGCHRTKGLLSRWE
jgi:hypothetical protein